MDTATLLTTFLPTLISLVCNFRQEKTGAEDLKHQAFVEWLAYHDHKDLQDLVARSKEAQEVIEVLLQANQQELIDKLDQIKTLLATLASQIEGFKAVAKILPPRAGLSEQAVDILRHLVNSGSEYIMPLPTLGRLRLCLSSGGSISVNDERFVRDDLNKLVEMGMLEERPRSGGVNYGITREAASFIQTLDSRKPSPPQAHTAPQNPIPR